MVSIQQHPRRIVVWEIFVASVAKEIFTHLFCSEQWSCTRTMLRVSTICNAPQRRNIYIILHLSFYIKRVINFCTNINACRDENLHPSNHGQGSSPFGHDEIIFFTIQNVSIVTVIKNFERAFLSIVRNVHHQQAGPNFRQTQQLTNCFLCLSNI